MTTLDFLVIQDQDLRMSDHHEVVLEASELVLVTATDQHHKTITSKLSRQA